MKNNYVDYISFICDLLTIEFPSVEFKREDEYFNQFDEEVEPFEIKGTSYATTYPKERIIRIDLDRVDNEMTLFIIFAHEIRHIYQYIALYEDDELRSELKLEDIRLWKQEMSDYQDSSDESYINQGIEIDAVAFSYVVCEVIFGIEVKSNCNPIKLERRISWMKANYTKDEILECAGYSEFVPRRILA